MVSVLNTCLLCYLSFNYLIFVHIGGCYGVSTKVVVGLPRTTVMHPLAVSQDPAAAGGLM